MPDKIPQYEPPGSADSRAAAKRFYASARWRRFRARILRRDPLCVRCLAETPPRYRASEHVHHLRARRDHPALAFNPENVVALCEACHPAAEAETRAAADPKRLPTLEDLCP
jgi:5-methylcytosine-specific restriction endonuclease McrA